LNNGSLSRLGKFGNLQLFFPSLPLTRVPSTRKI
jgi:hypothetical protein